MWSNIPLRETLVIRQRAQQHDRRNGLLEGLWVHHKPPRVDTVRNRLTWTNWSGMSWISHPAMSGREYQRESSLKVQKRSFIYFLNYVTNDASICYWHHHDIPQRGLETKGLSWDPWYPGSHNRQTQNFKILHQCCCVLSAWSDGQMVQKNSWWRNLKVGAHVKWLSIHQTSSRISYTFHSNNEKNEINL